MRGCKRTVKGIVTIEYTLLLPSLIVVYVFLIAMLLYSYNQCLLTTNLYLIANQGPEIKNLDAEEKVVLLKEKESKLYYKKYILVEDLQTSYLIKGDKIEIKGIGTMINIFDNWGLREDGWKVRAKCERYLLDGSYVLRIYKQLRDDLLHNRIEEE